MSDIKALFIIAITFKVLFNLFIIYKLYSIVKIYYSYFCKQKTF